MRTILTVATGLALSGMALADRPANQVNLEVRFLEVTSEGLRDLGADIGWGAGISANFAGGENPSVIPFVSATWDRMTGDNDLKIDMSGLMVGFRFRTSPNRALSESQTSIVLAEGYFQNRHEDISGDEKRKGVGFDIGLEVGPAMGSKGILWRFLYSIRPDTFGKKTQLMIITAAIPIASK
jgi:hypothetical protein